MNGLYAERSGAQAANATPVVLVHGWAMNAATWGEFGDALAERSPVFRVELPGHGRSFWAGETDLHAWAEQVANAVPQPAVWLAWSLGAAVALRAALDRPERMRGLILVGGTPRFVQGSDWVHAMAPDVLERFRDSLLADPDATVGRFLALQVRGTQGAGSTLRRLKAAMRAVPPARHAALTTGLDLLRGTDLRSQLRALRVPSLWLLGERDTLVPASMGWDLSAWLPEARVELVSGAGHAPFLSHPGEVLARATAFLDSHID